MMKKKKKKKEKEEEEDAFLQRHLLHAIIPRVLYAVSDEEAKNVNPP